MAENRAKYSPYRSHENREFEIYPVSSDADVPAQYVRLQSDMFAYGAYSMVRAMARAEQRAYLYYFTYAETGKRAPLGAYHGEELRLLSNSLPVDWERSGDDEKLGNEMRAYWTQFAKTGDPNGSGLPHWPAYNERSDQYFELGRSVGIHPVVRRLRVLEDLVNEVQHGLHPPRASR